MLIGQFDNQAFGNMLLREFDDAAQIDIATAWVRASGIRHFKSPIRALLDRGGVARIVVGLDAENTSIEALRELIDLQTGGGDIALYVRHNEASPIFHPKLYAFRNSTQCRIFVGSNNWTESGLFYNEEASGLLVGERAGDLEEALDQTMNTLCDLTSGITKRLTAEFAELLHTRSYAKAEASLPGKAANRTRRARSPEDRLFGFATSPRQPPRLPSPPNAARLEPRADTPIGDWQRIFMRLRLSRGTQAQIPAAVVRAIRMRLGYAAIDGPIAVTVAGGEQQSINPAYARGNPTPNTYKFEAFRPEGIPLLRIDVVGNEVIVEKLDSTDAAGAIVENFLRSGLDAEPPLTHRTRNDEESTWWRFA